MKLWVTTQVYFYLKFDSIIISNLLHWDRNYKVYKIDGSDLISTIKNIPLAQWCKGPSKSPIEGQFLY